MEEQRRDTETCNFPALIYKQTVLEMNMHIPRKWYALLLLLYCTHCIRMFYYTFKVTIIMPCLVSMGSYREDLNACVCGMSISVQHISITRIFNSSSSKLSQLILLGRKSPDRRRVIARKYNIFIGPVNN